MGSRTISESGLRYEIPYTGSFTKGRPGFTLNHVLSYRDRFDKYGLPRDVKTSIDHAIRAAETYARTKPGEGSENVRTDYFKVIRDYYTSEGPDNPGLRPMARFAQFIGPKKAKMVVKDLKRLKKELASAENTPEFKD